MSHTYHDVSKNIIHLIREWEGILLPLSEDVTSTRRNKQNRNIKQIVGHLIDSASNNQQRIVRLQYCEGNQLVFPDYYLDNDTWIAIQNYEQEDWTLLLSLLVSYNLHMAHLIKNIDTSKNDNLWHDADGINVTLKQMVKGYLFHLNLHFNEIQELIDQP